MNNFINIKDISYKSLRKILNDAKKRKLKRKKLETLDLDKDEPLKGKLLIQMFEKSSLRTRISFFLAIKQLGGSALTLRRDEIHFTKGGEKISDAVKTIGVYADAFMLRTSNDNKLEEISKYIKIPLINGLSPSSHPSQILSDVFTIEEIKKKRISRLNICWIGDCNNVLNSLIEASVKFSFSLNIACPKDYKPNKKILKWSKKNNANIKIYHNKNFAIKNADVLMTDKFVSMNDKVNKKKKIKKFKTFKIDQSLIDLAKRDVIFLHCLPRGDEVTDDVFFGSCSKVWTQAQNRVHVQKSILLYCLNKLR